MASLFTSNFRQNFIRMSSPAKILLVIFTVLIFLLSSSVVALLAAMPLFHLTMNEIYHIFSFPDAANIAIIKYFQIIESLFLFLVPAILAAWLFSLGMIKYLKADIKPSGITLLLVMGSLITAIPLMNEISLINSRMVLPGWMEAIEMKIRNMEENAGRLTELFLAGKNGRDLAVNIIMIAILPAVGEEFLFRGVLQRLFIEWTKNSHIGVWVAAFFFSFVHFQFYGFLPRMMLGLYFGYLLLWTSSIWVPVAGHLINNGFAVIYYYFNGGRLGETSMDKLGTAPGSHYMFYISVFITLMLLGIIYVHEKTRKVSPR